MGLSGAWWGEAAGRVRGAIRKHRQMCTSALRFPERGAHTLRRDIQAGAVDSSPDVSWSPQVVDSKEGFKQKSKPSSPIPLSSLPWKKKRGPRRSV